MTMYSLSETIRDKDRHLRCPNYSGNYDRSLVRLLGLNGGYKFEREVAEPEAVIVWDGSLEITLDGADRYSVGSGKMFFLPPGIHTSVSIVEDTTVVVVQLDMALQKCGLFGLAELLQYKHSIQEPFNPLPLLSCLKIFVSGMLPFLADGLLCSEYLKAKITEFIHIFRSYYPPLEQALFFYPLLGEDMSFNNFISRHIRRVKSVEEFARLANMSRSGFIDKFKRKMGGQSPAVYIKRHRLELIRADLLDAGLPLKEVAVRNGYDHYEVFSKFCKKNLGLSPSQVRNQVK